VNCCDPVAYHCIYINLLTNVCNINGCFSLLNLQLFNKPVPTAKYSYFVWIYKMTYCLSNAMSGIGVIGQT